MILRFNPTFTSAAFTLSAVLVMSSCNGQKSDPSDASAKALPTSAPAAPAGPSPRCKEAVLAVEKELESLEKCTYNSDCGGVLNVRGECKCVHHPVVRTDADMTKYNQRMAVVENECPKEECAPPVYVCDPKVEYGTYCDENHRCRMREREHSLLCGGLVNKYQGPSTLSLSDNGEVELTKQGLSAKGFFQCDDSGVLRIWGGLVAEAKLNEDGSVMLQNETFQKAPGAENITEPTPARDISDQSSFMPPSGDSNCTYTTEGGSGTYVPGDGGPELQCDYTGDGFYKRVVLGKRGKAQIIDIKGGPCCSIQSVLPEGASLFRGPFTCETKSRELTCKRNDGFGFVLGNKRIREINP